MDTHHSADIVFQECKPTYTKDNGIWVLDIDRLPLPSDFHILEKKIIAFPPNQYGGNHKHPRTEIFIVLGGNLVLVWLDSQGVKKERPLESTLLCVITPHIPHAVVNRSEKDTGILLELANAQQYDVQPVQVIG